MLAECFTYENGDIFGRLTTFHMLKHKYRFETAPIPCSTIDSQLYEGLIDQQAGEELLKAYWTLFSNGVDR